MEKNVCFVATNFFSKTSHSKQNSAGYSHKCIRFVMPTTRYSCQILIKLNSLDKLTTNPQITNFMKIHPLGAELFHAGVWTDGQA